MKLISMLFGAAKANPSAPPIKPGQNPLVDYQLKEAQRFFQLADYHQAMLHCEQALSQDASNVDAYRLRGVIRYELQDAQGATQDLHRSLGLA